MCHTVFFQVPVVIRLSAHKLSRQMQEESASEVSNAM
jgi:hypothetical protein